MAFCFTRLLVSCYFSFSFILLFRSENNSNKTKSEILIRLIVEIGERVRCNGISKMSNIYGMKNRERERE